MYHPIRGPYPENFQDNRWVTNGAYAGKEAGPRRSAPAEEPYLVQQGGIWRRGRLEVRKVKPKMFFIRPVDGKRLGSGGRFLDALTGQGPDVFVTKCGDKRTLMRDRPQRWQWSGWTLTHEEEDDLRQYDKDFREKDLFGIKNVAGSQKLRAHRNRYNFRTRRYESEDRFHRQPPQKQWTDARWRDGVKYNNTRPLCYRNDERPNRQWYSRVAQDAGEFPGGRPRNDY